jgi:leucyl/phenylalanyl-tRNA--protein transferase
MPVFRLGPEPIFPPVRWADPEGLLAVGGDLSPTRLLAAYRAGIFPWYEEGGPILWWSPDPRHLLFPDHLIVSTRLARTIRSQRFEVRLDTAFPQVIRACAEVPRRGEPGTWITRDMQAAYIRLHELGHAHCVETWRDGRLVGGIYGLRLGRAFCGESMFFLESDASKVALVALVEHYRPLGLDFVDCQVTSPHLFRMGAVAVSRAEFLRLLHRAQLPPRKPRLRRPPPPS